MRFTEFESIMNSLGIDTLAEIARALNTSPQAVSNWKARDQVPYHIANKINNLGNNNSDDIITTQSETLSPFASQKNDISISDILIKLAQQLKIILLAPFVTVFLTFTYVLFILEPIYESSATILLPENKGNMGGFSGLASQFGVNVPGSADIDLSSPSLFPELIKSRVFAERILIKIFYSAKFQKELPLIAILSSDSSIKNLDNERITQQTMIAFQNMVQFNNEGKFSKLIISSPEPEFAQKLNILVLDELKSLNRFFKSQHVNEKTTFIENRIKSVESDLLLSEKLLRSFREQNRQLSSPALKLEQERLARNVEVQKEIFLTLKQQLELSKIEEIQGASIVQVLDRPNLPLGASNKNIKFSLLLAGVLGLGLGVVLAFIRSFVNNDNIDERRKLRKVKNFIKKKGSDIVLDRRISGAVAFLLIIGLPYYLGHKSSNPVYFGMYSFNFLLINIIYILVLITAVCFFIYSTKKRNY